MFYFLQMILFTEEMFFNSLYNWEYLFTIFNTINAEERSVMLLKTKTQDYES